MTHYFIFGCNKTKRKIICSSCTIKLDQRIGSVWNALLSLKVIPFSPTNMCNLITLFFFVEIFPLYFYFKCEIFDNIKTGRLDIKFSFVLTQFSIFSNSRLFYIIFLEKILYVYCYINILNEEKKLPQSISFISNICFRRINNKLLLRF